MAGQPEEKPLSLSLSSYPYNLPSYNPKTLNSNSFTLPFYLKEYFLIENQQSATDNRYGPCLYVDSKTDGALVKVTGCKESDDKQNWSFTKKGQVQVSA